MAAMTDQQQPAGPSALSDGERAGLGELRKLYPQARISVEPGGVLRAVWPEWPHPVHAGSVQELADLLAEYA